MRSLCIFVLGLACAEALNSTSKCCPADMCYNGQQYTTQCANQGYAMPPKDGGDDPSCPSYESQCPAKCCEKTCCGAYGYPPGDIDSTCCHAASLSMPGEGDSRCLLRCDSPIKWKAHPTYVLDASGFDGATLPKKIILWNRPQGNFNENEFFVRDNSAAYDESGQTQGGKGWIVWHDQSSASHDLCLEATTATNGAAITVNECRGSTDPLQRWNLVETMYGNKIQLQDTNKCVNVVELVAKNAQPLELWDCNNDQMQSFDLQENINYPGATTLNV